MCGTCVFRFNVGRERDIDHVIDIDGRWRWPPRFIRPVGMKFVGKRGRSNGDILWLLSSGHYDLSPRQLREEAKHNETRNCTGCPYQHSWASPPSDCPVRCLIGDRGVRKSLPTKHQEFAGEELWAFSIQTEVWERIERPMRKEAAAGVSDPPTHSLCGPSLTLRPT